MHVYVDESGTFQALVGYASQPSVVASIALPSAEVAGMSADFLAMRPGWGLGLAEVKSTELSDSHFAEVAKLLRQHRAVATVVVVDAGKHTPPQIDALRKGQAAQILKAIPEGGNPTLIKDLRQQAKKWEQMSNELALQAHMMTCLLESTIRVVPTYFAQHDPAELGAFSWVIDAKDHTLSPYEKVWQLLVGLFLQSVFLKNPAVHVAGPGYDYTALMGSFGTTVSQVGGTLAAHLAPDDPMERIVDLKKLLSSRLFGQSDQEPGLQLADIIAGAARRAMVGKLGDESWKAVAGLLVRGESRAIRQVTFAGETTPDASIAKAMKIAEGAAQPLFQ